MGRRSTHDTDDKQRKPEYSVDQSENLVYLCASPSFEAPHMGCRQLISKKYGGFYTLWRIKRQHLSSTNLTGSRLPPRFPMYSFSWRECLYWLFGQ
jgi:hypothetical protein